MAAGWRQSKKPDCEEKIKEDKEHANHGFGCKRKGQCDQGEVEQRFGMRNSIYYVKSHAFYLTLKKNR